jgi:hypothetical protein
VARPTPTQYYYLGILAMFTVIGGLIMAVTIFIGISDLIYFYYGNGRSTALVCAVMATAGFFIMRTAWRIGQRYQARIENSN